MRKLSIIFLVLQSHGYIFDKCSVDDSCYGAETSTKQCCKTCSDVQEAYEEKNWKFIPRNIEQCDAGVCEDKNPLCPRLAGLVGCDPNSDFLDQCAKSCKKCQVSQDNVPKNVSIVKFHVNTEIQMRYAKSEIELEIQNPTEEKKETSFGLCIPERAFVSSFSMTIKEKTYEAKVKPKEEAKKDFDQGNENGGLVSSGTCGDDTKFIRFDIKLEAGEEASFHLSYEEYLYRNKEDRFHYKLSVPSNEFGSDDFKISVSINELADLFRLNIQRDNEEFTKNATISYNYDTRSDVIAMNLGQDTKNRTFVLSYGLERDDGHIFDIGGSKFIHSFLHSEPRHIIFVIDVSGSMKGQKQEDLIDALSTIIGALKDRENHYINIVSFNDTVEIWPKNEKGSTNSQSGHLEQAYEHILNLEFNGATNVNKALLDALEIAKNTRRQKTKRKINANDQLIVFLTDGIANVGVTSGSEIVNNVKRSQIKDELVRIHGIAFGKDADWNLVQAIAKGNKGNQEKISDKEDKSYIKIEEFAINILERNDYYFNYNINGEVVEKEQLNKTGIDLYESVIYGESNDGNTINEAKVNIVNTESGWKEDPIDMCTSADGTKRCGQVSSITSHEIIKRDHLIDRIRAQNRINWLLAEENKNCKGESNTNCKTEALNLSLEYEFVTSLTSLIVDESNEYITDEIIEEKPPSQTTSKTAPSQDCFLDYDSTSRCKVTLYIQTHLRGEHKIIYCNLGSLGDFDNEVASLRVDGDCSVTLYNEPNFKGEKMNFYKGSYEKALQLKKVFKKASSVEFMN